MASAAAMLRLIEAQYTCDAELELDAVAELAALAPAGSREQHMYASHLAKIRAWAERRCEAAERQLAEDATRPADAPAAAAAAAAPPAADAPTADAAADRTQWSLPLPPRKHPRTSSSTAVAAASQPSPSQGAASQSPQDSAFEEEYRCTVCLDLMYEPSTTACGHTFCRPCLLRALSNTTRCPLCRTDLGVAVPCVNTSMWNALQARMPERCAARKKQFRQEDVRRAAPGGGGGETSRLEEVAAIRAMLYSHRDRLTRGSGSLNYFALVENEFASGSGFYRCRCPERFVCLRFPIRNPASRHRGRIAVGCPLAADSGCGYYMLVE